MQSSNTSSSQVGSAVSSVLQTYQSIRFSKMAQTSLNPLRIINIPAFVHSLAEGNNPTITFRLHYAPSNPDTSPCRNMSASIVNAFLSYGQPFDCKFIHQDENYEVLDIGFSKNFFKIFLTDPKILSLLQQASIVEVLSENQKSIKTFLGQDLPKNFPTSFMASNLSYVTPAVTKHVLPPEYVDLWIALLQEKFKDFYQDVKDKVCSIEYYSGGQFKIKRKFSSEKPAIFTDPSDVQLLKDLQAVAIIPNCHPFNYEQRPLPVEAIIDADPSRFTTDQEKLFIMNALTEYLIQRNFVFHKHLSNGTHSGFHLIIQLELFNPFNMITNIASPQNYFHNLQEKIIINSVRESVVAFLLDFLRVYKSDSILNMASVEQNPYKLHLEVSRNSFNVGRRALLSMHKGTNSIVLPLPFSEFLTNSSLKDYTTLAVIDQAYAHSNELHEEPFTQSDIRKNTALMNYFNQEHYFLWSAYHKAANKTRFLQKL